MMATCSRLACRPCVARQWQATRALSMAAAADATRARDAVRGLDTCSRYTPSSQKSRVQRVSSSLVKARYFSASSKTLRGDAKPSIAVLGQDFPRDDYTNISDAILARVDNTPQLPSMPSHPLRLLQRQIEASMPGFTAVIPPSPIVSVEDNFGKLGFPEDHPGRSPTDTYYINRNLCLRTHTSTHEVDTFAAGHTQWLLTADVFRRDEIDASHYPVFHQMEGACVLELSDYNEGGRVEQECAQMEERLRAAQIVIEDNVDLQEAGGYQQAHLQSPQAQRAAALAMRHLKATLNNLVLDLFGERHAADVQNAAGKSGKAKGNATATGASGDSLKVRWISAYFPFTSPSFEVEVWFRGEWLEILGCGVVQQRTLDEANVKGKLGWAFGLGLERIAMVLFQIPDIRLFWSQDPRFLSQFARSDVGIIKSLNASDDLANDREAGVSAAGGASKTSSSKLPLITFKPYSKYPPCYKDASFWLPAKGHVHENDVFEIIRDVAGDLAETATLIDEFTHPKSGRQSKCFRINYRSMDRNLENQEVNVLDAQVKERLVEKLGVEMR